MRADCIGLYGQTCAGKSTTGKYLSSVLGCPYVSFGDAKRDEIKQGTPTGIAIAEVLKAHKPIPPALGYDVIESHLKAGLNIISGYPISIEEFDIFSARCEITGLICLTVCESELVRRFSLRRECPICHQPGIENENCPVHGIEMVRREDTSPEELASRDRLYANRIFPFLDSLQMIGLPRFDCDTGNLTRAEVSKQSEEWVKQLLAAKEGVI